MSALFYCLDMFSNSRYDPRAVPDDPVMCGLEYRCIRIFVDGDDGFDIGKADYMLYGTRNSACYVELWRYGLSGLAHLTAVWQPACIYNSP